MKKLFRYLMTLALVALVIPQLAISAKAAPDDVTWSQAATFTPGNSITGKIVRENYDYVKLCYKFTMNYGGEFSFNIVSDEVNEADVKIYTESKKAEVYDNVGGEAEDTASLPKGNYYLVVDGYGDEGSFTMNTSVAYAQDSQNYNSYSGAKTFTIGTDLYCNIGKCDEYDYEQSFYKFTISNGSVLTFLIESDKVGEADLKIFDSVKKDEVYDNDGGELADSVSLAAGTYYIRVDEYGDEGNFTLKTSVTGAPDSANNNSYSTAKAMTIGTDIKGNVGRNSTYDYEKSYYKFTMNKGGVLSYTISSAPVIALGVNSETVEAADLKIYNASQKEVYDNDGGELAGSASLAKGTYYLVVDRYDGEGNFTLSTSVAYASDSANYTSFSKAKVKTPGYSIYGNIGRDDSYSYEESYYKLTMANKGTLKLAMSSDTVEGLYIVVYNSSRTEIGRTWDNTSSFTLAKGTYYLKVTESSGTGNYRLKTSVTYNNPMTVTASKTSVKYSKTKNQTIKLTVKNAVGKVTYKSSYSKVTVSSKGVVTVKKGAKKCTVTITIKAAGSKNSSGTIVYKALTKTIKIKIK